ncbi:unnamed protein product [Macrosiphum euphorbiae]|uniref:DUF4806 domain-containing protein n=1 Tax=Macrosiphum euphorbiae TaxID=13131 RepID=A0AAV0XF05_9HEMI|nr:unnamed protein product [Macrosiphum euphorbiae]CAI6367094.1 unnamed protein product [Macrosiphum euphorbiae]
MWSVVHFLDDSSVEAVPSYWVDNDKCAWPKNNYRAAKLRDNRAKPNKFEFDFYRAKVLSKNIPSLIVAKEKTNRAQFTTDISDYDDNNETQNLLIRSASGSNFQSVSRTFDNNSKYNLGLKIKTNKRENLSHKSLFNVSELSDDDGFNMLSDNSIVVNEKYDSPVFKKQKIYTSSANSNDQNLENSPSADISIESQQLDNVIVEIISDVEPAIADIPSTTLVSTGNNGNSSLSIHRNKAINKNTNQPNSTDYGTNPKNDMAESGSQSNNNAVNKTLLNYMAYIKIEINKISDVQQQILQQISVLNEGCNSNKTPAALVEEIDYFISTWPLSSHDELNDMEQKIQFEKDFKNKVVCELIRVGGKSLKDMIYKMMKKIFADTLLQKFTYFGLRNKCNFSTLYTNKAIFDAIRKSKYKAATDDEIVVIIGKWLTTSSSRIEKK